MAIIRKPCKYCNKVSDITSEIDLGASGKLLVFACNHSYIEASLAADTEKKSEDKTGEHSLYHLLKNAPIEFCEEHQRQCIKVVESKSGKHFFPFQRDGICRAFENNAKFIFADEMGLGKTAQGLGTLLLDPDELLPALFVCKSIAKANMMWEVMDWLQIPAQVISKSSETPWDMFKVHIISYDMMNRLDKMFKFSDMKPEIECPECHFRCDEGKHEFCPNCAQTKRATGDTKQSSFTEDGKIITDFSTRVVDKPGHKVAMVEYVDKTLIYNENPTLKEQNKAAWTTIIKRCKTIILDEVHLIKNESTQRSKAIKGISALIPHKLPLSGTLMKNNATEYFVPLNIVYPEKYWRMASFCNTNVRYEAVRSVTGKLTNKFTGLIDPKGFFKSVEKYMIRRTTDEVLPQLPKLFKQPKYVELDEQMKEIYDRSEAEFAKWFDNASDLEIRQNILAQLALLRHQTSLAKVEFTIDLAMDFVLQTDRKLAIFTHHIDSREILADNMIRFFKETQNEIGVCVLTQDNKIVQQELENFKNSERDRIIILSTLSHGESLNMQFMGDCILHERQWNPSNEDQAISGRFRRIGSEFKSIQCQIPVAIGTIDEFYVELNERKRGIGKEIDTKKIEGYDNSGFVAELAARIAAKGREKWRL